MTDVIERDAEAGSAGGGFDDNRLRELVEQARSDGLRLTGEGGLLGRLTKLVVESAPGARWTTTWATPGTTRPGGAAASSLGRQARQVRVDRGRSGPDRCAA